MYTQGIWGEYVPACMVVEKRWLKAWVWTCCWVLVTCWLVKVLSVGADPSHACCQRVNSAGKKYLSGIRECPWTWTLKWNFQIHSGVHEDRLLHSGFQSFVCHRCKHVVRGRTRPRPLPRHCRDDGACVPCVQAITSYLLCLWLYDLPSNKPWRIHLLISVMLSVWWCNLQSNKIYHKTWLRRRAKEKRSSSHQIEGPNPGDATAICSGVIVKASSLVYQYIIRCEQRSKIGSAFWDGCQLQGSV